MMSNDTLSVLLRLTQSYTALTRLTRLSLVSVSLTREGFPDAKNLNVRNNEGAGPIKELE